MWVPPGFDGKVVTLACYLLLQFWFIVAGPMTRNLIGVIFVSNTVPYQWQCRAWFKLLFTYIVLGSYHNAVLSVTVWHNWPPNFNSDFNRLRKTWTCFCGNNYIMLSFTHMITISWWLSYQWFSAAFKLVIDGQSPHTNGETTLLVWAHG